MHDISAFGLEPSQELPLGLPRLQAARWRGNLGLGGLLPRFGSSGGGALLKSQNKQRAARTQSLCLSLSLILLSPKPE
ncbi:hypothetical protein Pyn_18232 [Prunus yedoensis var. nudiflora]|uniref:Uncharacterized protein n=1 Tax=Prunus yedoensis var. nudiflora TaxID=2094558 RepID=A0A314XYE0_PRUYE|nr:hypothetical protein Pyn_18232 [Prunus yedoensis var. nudiflora]